MIYEVDIDDPREIRNLSEAVLEEADNSEEDIYVGLNHNHHSIVRGRNEEFRDIDPDFDTAYPDEIIREDGGNTWVHSPESRCYEKAASIDPVDSKSHEKLMAEWGREAVNHIESYLEDEELDIDPVYQGGDIYDINTGKQIAGLSAEIHGETGLFRMCMYDGDEHGAEFHELIDKDLEASEENITDLREDYIPLPGFYSYLMPESPEEIGISQDLTTGNPRENALPAEYCISRRQSS